MIINEALRYNPCGAISRPPPSAIKLLSLLPNGYGPPTIFRELLSQ